METLNLFREIYRKFTGRRGRPSRDDLAAAFRFRYACFKDLLDSNTQLLNIITDLEEKLPAGTCSACPMSGPSRPGPPSTPSA